jgi:signal transduction histidine kinase/DNA-binding NarL/FixJ family response regulator
MRSAQCNRGTQPSGYRTANGRLWFATINGMVMIDPREVPSPPAAPTAVVEQVFNSGVLSREDPSTGGGLDIEFRYTAPSFLNPEIIRFSYKLDGYHDDWIFADTHREARFSNLPPGSYTFKVRAAKDDGVWGAESHSVRMSITPLFIHTTWFLMVCILATSALAVLAYRVRTVRRRIRERELVVLVACRTAEARAAQEAAEQANRAKNRFLAVLSHELRTPLTPVLLSVGSLLDKQLPAEAHEQLDMIRRNIELESRLVDDLLDVSRIERGHLRLEFELVDVHQAIRRALEVCDDEIRRNGLEVILNLRAQEHHVRGDYARLIQVFWNLIRNAAKFTAPSGTLTIHSRADSSTNGLGGTRVIIEFCDTGVGIDPHQLGRIFDPFEQGSDLPRDRRGGLGLGLAICRAVAEAHGGRLTAESAGRGLGSTFRLELEASPAPATRPTPSPRVDNSPRCPGGLRILLVEDNVDTLRYLGMILCMRGHEIVQAATLCAAREAIAAGTFDLLISDIELPDGTGLELMRELRSRGVPGIALSGYGSTDDVQLSQDAGFALHLIKPIVADTIDAAIARVAKLPQRVSNELKDNSGGNYPNGSHAHTSEVLRSSTPAI